MTDAVLSYNVASLNSLYVHQQEVIFPVYISSSYPHISWSMDCSEYTSILQQIITCIKYAE